MCIEADQLTDGGRLVTPEFPSGVAAERLEHITVNAFSPTAANRALDREAVAYLITATGYAENTGMGWKNTGKNTVGRD